MSRHVSVRFKKGPRKNQSCGLRYRIVKRKKDTDW